jgi:hypothetical protein
VKVTKSTKKRSGRTWTQAGAARAAREARIATVRHLQTAQIARAWEQRKLLTAFQHQVAHIGHAPTARAVLFGGMGYRPPFPTDWAEATERVLADEARYLVEADLYILSPQMCDVVIAAAQTLTLDDLELLDDDDLPGRAGLVMLPHPIIVRTAGGALGDTRAFTWRTPSQIQHPTSDERGLEDRPAVRISVYDDTHGPVQPDSFRAFAAQARALGTPLAPLLLDGIRCVPFRYTASEEQKQSRVQFHARLAEHGDATRAWHAEHGEDENRVIGDYTPGSQIDNPDDSFSVRFLYAFWRLCEQRIASVTQAEINHSARTTAERIGASADVRVVQLRRTDQPGEQRPAGRDYQHRWVVRMHKVRQWYPSLGQHKVIYRGPYIKGPDGKPLLSGETIRSLNR